MSSPWFAYGALVLSIASEVIGTTCLQYSQQFTRPLPTLLMAVFYALAFYGLSHVLKVMPMGVAYAIWSGLGVVFVSIIGVIIVKQTPDIPAIIGMIMIVGGVVIINLWSKSLSH